MSKLTRPQIRHHEEAIQLLKKDKLTTDDAWFVMENFREDANHMNAKAGAFFTPPMLAKDAAIEYGSPRKVVDLCAGIGTLSYFLSNRYRADDIDITCIEINPAYVEVGKKLVPQATWICADIFEFENTAPFDLAISNPPFGPHKFSTANADLNYSGSSFEFKVIELASRLARRGTFIIPQASTPFTYSGTDIYRATKSANYEQFTHQTGIILEMNCGIDTSTYERDWHGVEPRVEIANGDFDQAKHQRNSKEGPAQPHTVILTELTTTTPLRRAPLQATLFDYIDSRRAAAE